MRLYTKKDAQGFLFFQTECVDSCVFSRVNLKSSILLVVKLETQKHILGENISTLLKLSSSINQKS